MDVGLEKESIATWSVVCDGVRLGRVTKSSNGNSPDTWCLVLTGTSIDEEHSSFESVLAAVKEYLKA